VFLNLLLNAAQAIPDADPDRHQVAVALRAAQGPQVVVEVRDSGCGIREADLPRLFEPFFTTKAAGVGTGLGLFICKQIVEEHGGRIEVETEWGRGSTFRVWLPATTAPRSPRTPVPFPAAQTGSGRARVLIIDDEPKLAESMRLLLEPEHDVTVTTSGQEGLQCLLDGPPFDLILCDLQMPGVTGMDLHAALEAQAPAVLPALLFMSGGAFTSAAQEFVGRHRERVLDKPLRPERLFALVEEALARSAPAA
jgi:CheY-like chemotaxis protein